LGANQLQSVTSPVAGTSNSDTAVYSYDALNRVLGYSINGIAQSIGYDNIGRLASASNALDSNFVYNYSDGTSRITSVTSNNGPSIALTYFPATGSEFELLNTLSYTPNGGGTALQQFTYAYYADSKVNSLAVTTPSALTTTYNYDPANRLTSAPLSTGSQYTYGYDHASNLTSIAPPSGSGSPQSYTYTSTNGITSATYDANGSPTLLGTNLYKWDGANRVILFSNTASNIASRFVYDGFGRLVRVVDIQSGAITADHSYTWCGSMRCVAHDNTQSGSPVSTQYFPQGVIVSGTSYYYVQDQLGSVTELVTSGGSVAVQYTYDPYGNRTTASGTAVSDIGYAGYFYHAASGLDFTLHRAYDPVHARWLNRDPIGETGGVNLYAYTNGNPVSNSDPTGLIDQQTLTFGGLFPSPSEAQGFAAQQAAAATQSQIATEVVNSVLPLSAGITVTVPTGQWLVPTAAVFRYRHDANGTMCSIGWGARAGSGNATSYRPSVAYSATSFGDTGGLGWTNSVSTPAIAGPFGYSATSTIFFDGAYSSSHGPAIVGGQWSASSVLSYTVSW
jgi:RHS repeat-associated protein